MTDVSVVIPVKDGERYLDELLEALAAQGEPLEVLVIDSGSRDRSVAIARAAGVRVHEIEPGDFGHGRTRNLGAELTSGDLVAFLTQDATPVPGWVAGFREAFAAGDDVGAAFGPHLPRPGTSPMIARELTEFFAGFSPDGSVALQRDGDEPFLSNVNACYRRDVLEAVGFRDVPYAEDQAFGRDLLAAGRSKAYAPRAAVLHAHDYGPVEFMRRYFDEYRGLRDTAGHVEPIGARSLVREVRGQVARDRGWMRDQGMGAGELSAWTARSLVHHAGRKVASAAGSRADRLPAPARRALSLEGRADAATRATGLPPSVPMGPRRARHEWEAIARYRDHGPAPLIDPVPGMADRDSLHIAVIVPPFKVGSGGHNTIFQTVMRLERMGHTCSIWLHDPSGDQKDEWPAVVRKLIVDHFAPVRAPVYNDFANWFGADVVMATGWQTAWPAMLLDNVRARAYFVNDHEPEFYPTSFESHFAAESYRLGMYCIAASPWLRDVMVDRYGAAATDFQLGVDHSIYHPRPIERRRDTVVFYGRAFTARRGVGMATLAIEELLRRRPKTRVISYGDLRPLEVPYTYQHVGIATPEQLSWLYSQGTVGLCLSLTNFSLIPKEMLACGMPCVELAGVSAESIFGPDGGPLELAPFDHVALADAVERLLDDDALWAERSRAGIEFVASHTWDVCAEQTERGLREALRLRERELEVAPS
jgi:glycosyltransferase involved in cell wall biosynthesis/GT2 family glycosyltransferase